MATPTKFSLGGMPKTRTGLVPTTYQRTADYLSEPKHWEQLPTKPKPTLYPYRGDVINAKNRKIARERKIARKEKLRLLNGTRRSEGDSLGSSLLVTPRNVSAQETQSPAPDNTKQFDTYTQHRSCHRLPDEQERSRVQNRNKFSEWLRSEASKRQERKRRESKGDKENRQNEEQPVVRQRKPPVPRLSRLVRAGGKKEKRRGGKPKPNKTIDERPHSSKPERPNETGKAEGKASTKAKVGYLDFITEKKEGRNEESASEAERPDSAEDDDSKFRIQIERIVSRAAEMVLREQCDASGGYPCENNESAGSPSDASAAAKVHDLIRSQNELAALEEKIKNLSSPVAKESDERSLSSSTLFDRTEDSSATRLTAHRDVDSLSEALPRTAMQPMNVPAWHQGSFDTSFDTSNILRGVGLDLSSCATEATSEVSGTRALATAISSTHDAASRASDSDTAMPRETHPSLSHKTPPLRLEPCPEEVVMLPVKPSRVPSRVQWDEAPIPRGFEVPSEASYIDSLEEEPLPRGFAQGNAPLIQGNETGQALVDDLFALF